MERSSRTLSLPSRGAERGERSARLGKGRIVHGGKPNLISDLPQAIVACASIEKTPPFARAARTPLSARPSRRREGERDHEQGEARRGPLTHVAVGLLEGLAETR